MQYNVLRDKPQGHYVKKNKPITKDTYDSTHVKYLKWSKPLKQKIER